MDQSAVSAVPESAPQSATTSPPPTPPAASRIVNAAATVMIFFLLSRLTGVVREIVIAAQFRAGDELDAYLTAFRVPDLIFQLVAGGALGSAFIPTFSSYCNKPDHAGTWLLFSRILILTTLLLTFVAAIAALFALPLVRGVIAPGFSEEQALLTAQLMRWMLISTVIFGASGLVMGALNAVHHFVLPAVAPVIYNVTIILGAWLLSARFGSYGLAIGVVGGALGHLLIQLPGLWRAGVRYTPSLDWQDESVRTVGRLMGPRVLGLFFVQMQFLANTILASNLPAGSLSALNYAWLLMLLPQGIFAQSLATAAFPTLAALVATHQLADMRRTFGQTLRTVFFVAIPSAVALYFLGEVVVAALLQRGEFTAEDTRQAAYALQFYAVGLIAHSGLEIVVRAFYALQDTMTPVIIGIAAMILNILLSFWWVQWLSFGGLALANSVATTIELLILLWLLRRRFGTLDGRLLTSAVARQMIAAFVMGIALWFWLRVAGSIFQPLDDRLIAWLSAAGGILIGTVIYGLTAWIIRSEEARLLLALVGRRLHR